MQLCGHVCANEDYYVCNDNYWGCSSKKLGLKKIAPCSTKVAQSSTEVAQYSAKVGNKKISSKHIHAGSSFEDLVAMNPKVKTDLNSNVWFKRYDFLKI